MLRIMPTDEALEGFEKMKLRHKIAFIVFKVARKDEDDKKCKDEVIKIDVVATKADVGDGYLGAFIEATKNAGTCRYGVVDWNNKLLFVAWSPDTAKGKDKMVYASIREAFIEALVGIQIKIQCTDDGEFSEEEIIKKTQSKV
eukprot:UN02722